MALYVTRCTLSINGKNEKNFKAVTEKGVTAGIQVALMNETGYGQKTKRWQVDLDYVVPQVNEFDFTGLVGGTLTIEYDSGTRNNYGDVNILEIGDATIDGDNELVRKITVSCGKKNNLKGSE